MNDEIENTEFESELQIPRFQNRNPKIENISLFKEDIININENNITDKAPSILKPGYWKSKELDDKKTQNRLKA